MLTAAQGRKFWPKMGTSANARNDMIDGDIVAYVKCYLSLSPKHVNTVLMLTYLNSVFSINCTSGSLFFPLFSVNYPERIVFPCRVHRFSICKDRILLVMRGRFRFLLSWGIHSIAVPCRCSGVFCVWHITTPTCVLLTLASDMSCCCIISLTSRCIFHVAVVTFSIPLTQV